MENNKKLRKSSDKNLKQIQYVHSGGVHRLTGEDVVYDAYCGDNQNIHGQLNASACCILSSASC